MRLVPMEGDRFHLGAEEAVALCDENTIGVVAILGSTFDGSYEPVAEICAALDDLQARDRPRRAGPRRRRLRRVRRAVHRPRARVGLPPPARRLDQRVGPQVRPRLPGRRLDRLARRGGAARGPDLLGQLPRRQHAHVRAQLLAARARRSSRSTTTSSASASTATARCRRTRATSRRGCRRGSRSSARSRCSRRATSCRCSRSRWRDEIDNYTVFDVSNALRERGWLVPAYTFPANRTDLAALRVVVKQGFSHDMADMLVDDLRGSCRASSASRRRSTTSQSASSFRH